MKDLEFIENEEVLAESSSASDSDMDWLEAHVCHDPAATSKIMDHVINRIINNTMVDSTAVFMILPMIIGGDDHE